MTINQKKSLVAFYISKFNDDAFRELGYSGPVSKAMDDLSVRITGPGVEPNAYLRRRRDEFDVFFDNGRAGQHNRKPTATVTELYEQWDVMEFKEITEIVKSVLDGTMEETQVINLDVDGEKVSEYDVEQYLNFDDNTAALNKTVKSVIERTYSKKKVNINRLWNRRQTTKFNGTSYIVQRAAEATYSPVGKIQIQESIDYYMRNASLLKDCLQKVGLQIYGGDNAPYIWVKTPNELSSWKFFDRLLCECHIVGTPGVGFGPSGEGYFRLTAFGRYEDTIESISRIQNWKL